MIIIDDLFITVLPDGQCQQVRRKTRLGVATPGVCSEDNRVRDFHHDYVRVFGDVWRCSPAGFDLLSHIRLESSNTLIIESVKPNCLIGLGLVVAFQLE